MSTIIATTLSNGSVSVPTATVVNGSAKAWVNFNGTGTIAVRDSFNVASITDNALGSFIVVFTNAMLNDGHVAQVSTWQSSSTTGVGHNVFLASTTQQSFETRESDTTTDPLAALVSIHGDLA